MLRLALCLGALLWALPCIAAVSPAGLPAVVSGNGDTVFADGFEFRPPNILLVIMDDVGVDQIPSFGYGGSVAPSMPSIDAIAEGGLRFRNTWSMPECSPGRSVLLTGRYPLRNNLYQALGPNDLANSQISPYEVTAPKLLRNANYESAMFGKFHLAGPENNAAENATPSVLGWDDFYGWTGGLPGSIDTTAGGVGDEGDYSCGFVPDTARDPVLGADSGACYVPVSGGGFTCSVLAGTNPAGDSPGLQCLTNGGILVPGQACESDPPAGLAWDRENAHYVSPLVINHDGTVEEVDLADPRSRGYRATIEADAAIDWILDRAGSDRPWMATLSFSSDHTPLQQPPGALLPSGVANGLTADCVDTLNQRRLSDALIESMDTELGRVLVETGIAEPAPGGGLAYDPAASNTVVVIYGDNGSFGPTVKLPFDATRAKGSAYQTGVWVPLIVAGPMVASPGRAVEHMVNGADVFRLFGDLAGLDVPALVPRVLDSVPMSPYLHDPDQTSLRAFNFTQGGLNIQKDGGRNGPCVFGSMCSHTPTSKSVCEDNGGVWWGVGADDPGVIVGDLEQCWQVNQAIYQADPANYPDNRITMGWTEYQAVRNEHFKLVRNRALDYDPAIDDGVEIATEEFYRIDQAAPIPLLDTEDRDLLAHGGLNPVQQQNFDELEQELEAILASKMDCPGDGNDDGNVDQADLDNYDEIVSEWNGSSSYDFDYDGVTDATDRQVIEDNLGTDCLPVGP